MPVRQAQRRAQELVPKVPHQSTVYFTLEPSGIASLNAQFLRILDYLVFDCISNVIVRPRSCQENLAEALAPYGIKGEDINDCFNVFMDVELNGDGAFVIRAPTLKAGDYVDLLAEMDILAAISACPSDTSPSNGGKPKPLGIRVFA